MPRRPAYLDDPAYNDFCFYNNINNAPPPPPSYEEAVKDLPPDYRNDISREFLVLLNPSIPENDRVLFCKLVGNFSPFSVELHDHFVNIKTFGLVVLEHVDGFLASAAEIIDIEPPMSMVNPSE